MVYSFFILLYQGSIHRTRPPKETQPSVAGCAQFLPYSMLQTGFCAQPQLATYNRRLRSVSLSGSENATRNPQLAMVFHFGYTVAPS